MTATALPLSAPTRAERWILRLTRALTQLIEHRVERRARRRATEIDIIQRATSRPRRVSDVDHLLAFAGVPRR